MEHSTSLAKQARIFVRTNSKKDLRPEPCRRRRALPVVGMCALLYTLLNAVSKAEMSYAGSKRGLANTGSNGDMLSAQEVPPIEQQSHRRLRAVSVSSVYNKNSDPEVQIIADEEWENHAFLTTPKLRIAEDPDHIWPEIVPDETPEEIVAKDENPKESKGGQQKEKKPSSKRKEGALKTEGKHETKDGKNDTEGDAKKQKTKKETTKSDSLGKKKNKKDSKTK